MTSRWLTTLGFLLILPGFGWTQTPSAPVQTVGYLFPATAPPKFTQTPLPYMPQPGDIVLYDDFNRFFHFVFKVAGTAPPTHVAMVIAGADGKPALLELTGPKVITAKVAIMDVEPRLSSYPGVVMVRRIRAPLTLEQSRDLTKFAETEAGKSFALGRVVLQGTPFCPRTGWRQDLFGHTYLTRNRWFCSELVVAAGAAAHLYAADKYCANATYPRDLAYDETMDLSALYHPPVLWNARR